MTASVRRDFDSELQTIAARIEPVLEEILSLRRYRAKFGQKLYCISDRLRDAIRYSALAGGKRIRAFLTLVTARGFDPNSEEIALRVGAAIEFLHCYSLIHDDLPSIDDASLRRGRPALHFAFDEATAILAGDALQALAFSTIANLFDVDCQMRCELISGLSLAAGSMVDGQMLDLATEGRFSSTDQNVLDGADICDMQAMKTGALIRFAVDAGGIIGKTDPVTREHLQKYGEIIGLAFQLSDDLLSLQGSPTRTGKDVANDTGKVTLATLYGVERVQKMLRKLCRQAEKVLSRLEIDTSLLNSAARFIVDRNH